MENNYSEQSSAAAAAAAQSAGYHYPHLLEQKEVQMEMFWNNQRQEIEQANDLSYFKSHQLPLSRIKKMVKSDKNVRLISSETPLFFAKACEMFISELTLRSWLHAQENKRRTLQKMDISSAVRQTELYDFLVDIVHKEEAATGTVGLGSSASGGNTIPYYNPPMCHQPVPFGTMMMGRARVSPSVYVPPLQPPSQAWHTVWQPPPEYNPYYASGGNSGDGQR